MQRPACGVLKTNIFAIQYLSSPKLSVPQELKLVQLARGRLDIGTTYQAIAYHHAS